MRPQPAMLVSVLVLALSTAACGSPSLPPARTAAGEAASATFAETDVRYRSGDLELAAALLLPGGAGPFPGAVILQGSGDSDRGNDWAREIAEGLARRGIATLLTDKRGSGASQGDWRTSDFRALASDALAGVAFLRAHPRVAREGVGLVGLSQGGTVAPLAAAESTDVAFVVDVSGSATTAVEQVNHEMRNTFRQAGLDEEQVEEGMRLQALAGDFLRTGAWDPYAAAREEALRGPLAPVAEGFPAERGSWVWTFWRGILDHDPIPAWRRLRQPVLVVYGERDERDNVPVAESVRRLEAALAGRSAPWRVEVVPGTGHALFLPDSTTVDPRVLDLLAEHVHRSARERG